MLQHSPRKERCTGNQFGSESVGCSGKGSILDEEPLLHCTARRRDQRINKYTITDGQIISESQGSAVLVFLLAPRFQEMYSPCDHTQVAKQINWDHECVILTSVEFVENTDLRSNPNQANCLRKISRYTRHKGT
jgi:hypothetical protein